MVHQFMKHNFITEASDDRQAIETIVQGKNYIPIFPSVVLFFGQKLIKFEQWI